MSTDAVAVAGRAMPMLDYYLILPEAGERRPQTEPVGILVEEFALAEDHSAVGLNSAGWTPADGRWWSSAAFSRGMRADPALRARIAGASRSDAELAYRRLGGGELPDEAMLRRHFRDYEPLSGSAPLWLRADPVPDGFDGRRVYRVLFAGDLTGDRLAGLLAAWQMTHAGDVEDPRARVLGTARLLISNDVFTWDLRRIGSDVAWCVDLTVYLGPGACGAAIGPLLWELRAAMRQQGLIPVTVERFS